MIYKLYKDLTTNTVTSVIKIEGEVRSFIPFDPANTDYQAYLAWVAEGNTPGEPE